MIDEVAGQLIAYLGLATPRTIAVNWKYLLLGFILFRVFDIWKPFPARQAESLPGGLGIMADDWIAGVYAALGLWLVRPVSRLLAMSHTALATDLTPRIDSITPTAAIPGGEVAIRGQRFRIAATATARACSLATPRPTW